MVSHGFLLAHPRIPRIRYGRTGAGLGKRHLLRYSTNDAGFQRGQPALQTGWVVFESVNFTHQLGLSAVQKRYRDSLNISQNKNKNKNKNMLPPHGRYMKLGLYTHIYANHNSRCRYPFKLDPTDRPRMACMKILRVGED